MAGGRVLEKTRIYPWARIGPIQIILWLWTSHVYNPGIYCCL